SDAQYEWMLRTREAGDWSAWTTVQRFSRVTPPHVMVVEPSGPVVDDLSPLVAWTADTGSYDPVSYRVRIRPSAGGADIYDSGVLLSAETEHQVPPQDDFSNGTSYTFLVEVAQTGGASARASTTQTVSWTPP